MSKNSTNEGNSQKQTPVDEALAFWRTSWAWNGNTNETTVMSAKYKKALRYAHGKKKKEAKDYLLIGIEHLMNMDFKKAERMLRRAIALDPTLAIAHNELGIVLVWTKRPDEAEKEFREALRLDPSHCIIFYQYALFLEEEERYSESEKVARMGLKLYPSASDLISRLAYSQMKRGKIKQAESNFRRALKLDVTNEEAGENLVGILTKQHRQNEAKSLLRSVLKKRPEDNSWAYVQISKIYSDQNKSAQAMAWVVKGIKLDWRNPDLLRRLITICFRETDQKALGAATCRLLLRIEPDDAYLYFWQGTYYEEKKNWKKAEEKFRKALSMDSDSVYFLNHLSWVLCKRGKSQEALPFLRRALKLEESDPWNYYMLAKALQENGKDRQAEKVYQGAIQKGYADETLRANFDDFLMKKKD